MMVFSRKEPLQKVLDTCRGKLHIKKAKGAALLEGEEVWYLRVLGDVYASSVGGLTFVGRARNGVTVQLRSRRPGVVELHRTAACWLVEIIFVVASEKCRHCAVYC